MLLTNNDPIGKSTSTRVGGPERSVRSFGRQIPNTNKLMPGAVTQWVVAAYQAAISGVIEGDLASALLIRRPRAVVEYWQNCLFVWLGIVGRKTDQELMTLPWLTLRRMDLFTLRTFLQAMEKTELRSAE